MSTASTGLIPSATDYGNAILAAANGHGDLHPP